MKEIRMDYESYLEELDDERRLGVENGLEIVAEWLSSKLSISQYLKTRDFYAGYVRPLQEIDGIINELLDESEELAEEALEK
jgi:hypothetical protein